MSVVQITGTSGTDSRDQLDAALVDHGLDRATVTELPFGLDTSLATNLTGLFEGMAALEVVPSMYILNVTVMDSMFDGCAALTTIPDLRTGNVTSAVRMLAGTSALVDGQVRLIGRNQGVDTTDMIVGSGLTREPFYDEITAPPPTFDDVYVEVILPDIDVVEYTVIGEPERGAQVRVTAAPVGWVVLTGITEWVHTFPSVEGPSEPVPGDQPSEPPGPQPPLPGSYASRNAGRRASILEAFTQIVNKHELDAIEGGLRDDINNQGQVLTDYGDQLEAYGRDRVMPWAVPTVAPLSQTVNRWADATYQIGNMLTPHNYTNSPPLIGDWNHTTRRHFVFITPAVTRAYSQINIMIGELVSGTAPVWEFAIYVMDENGVMERVYGPHQFTDGVGFGDEMATIQLDNPVVVDQGSYIAVGFRKVSGGERYLLGLLRMDYPLPAGVLPPGLSGRMAGGGELPTLVDARTQIDFGPERFVPYVELSEAVKIPLRHFTESWPDVGDAQRPWLALTSRGIGSRGGYTAAVGYGTRVSIYDTPLSTDYVRVRTSVYRLFDNNQYSFIAVRATNDMTAGVGLIVSNNYGYRLLEWSGTNSNQHLGTVIQSIARPPQEGDQIEIDYLNGLVTVRINDAVEIDNAEAGGPQGASGRFVGLRLQRDRTGIPGFYSYHPSPWLGPWSARDLPQDNGDDEDGDGEGEG